MAAALALPLSRSGRISHPLGVLKKLTVGTTMNLLVMILLMIGSSTSIGFGI
jgi:hypothetical protein